MEIPSKFQGQVWKYGDNVNTDLLFPGKYTYTLREPSEIARHALEDLDPTFVGNVNAGDIVVGGRNFGCGSSREQGATCLVYNGVSAVVAHSFGRIFYRNALNNGLLAITCPEAVDDIAGGELLHIDLIHHRIETPRGRFAFPPLSQSVLQIVDAGGLIEYVKKIKLTQHIGNYAARS
ncbi:MAG: 3-isopropylmalate dehydratase [Chloroflexota bacterium]